MKHIGWLASALICSMPLCKSAGLPTMDTSVKEINRVSDIPLPKGFRRVVFPDGSFPLWLRSVKLKNDKRVFLYNG